MIRLPLVEVVWRDSHSIAGWHREEALNESIGEEGILECKTAGYLYKDTPETLVVIQNISDSGQVGEAMAIPKSNIKSITHLRKK